MKISKRLLKIIDFIEKDEVVFDVGSDHALLPSFLVYHNICFKTYAADNKEGPLLKAKETIDKYNLHDKVIPVLSDGLENIKDDVDVIVIAGMGQYTAQKILENKDLTKYKKIIVQVNRDMNLMRKFISDNNYTILNEAVVYEDYYYEILVFNTDYHQNYSDLEIKYGPFNLKNKNQVFLEYLKFNINKYEMILKKHNSEDLNNEVACVKEIIKKYF